MAITCRHRAREAASVPKAASSAAVRLARPRSSTTPPTYHRPPMRIPTLFIRAHPPSVTTMTAPLPTPHPTPPSTYRTRRLSTQCRGPTTRTHRLERRSLRGNYGESLQRLTPRACSQRTTAATAMCLRAQMQLASWPTDLPPRETF